MIADRQTPAICLSSHQLKAICTNTHPSEEQLNALTRLWIVARNSTSQSKRIASFLLNFWGGIYYKFDMTEFKTMEKDLLDDCVAVIQLLSTSSQSLTQLLGVTEDMLQALANHHKIRPYYRVKK